VVAVLEQSATRLKVASREWRKQPLAEWWAGVRNQMEPSGAAAGGEYKLAAITAAASACANDTWAQTDSFGTNIPPSARISHPAVWTGAEMIVWGGQASSGLNTGGVLRTGGRYNPLTDSWTPTNPHTAPISRFVHTAVWTGTEMIVWGGGTLVGSQLVLLDTGGRYNPLTDSWIATSTTNAPTARVQHSAVWTGTEMIVWSGISPGVLNITGGRYNPLTDSWTATSATNAPAGRIGHTAVWTGAEMIIWGGYDPGPVTVLNTGGCYNPMTDSWTATSPANAPAARYIHTAVWTGAEMIVWGGFAFADPVNIAFNDGRRYNPLTDSWTATSLVNAPAARLLHTAVWTGAEMIVWGGGADGNFNSGGRYNPTTDSWSATSAANAPAARGFHSAVWTGAEMIVWGGAVDNSTYFNSGGRYNPVSDSWSATSGPNGPSRRSFHSAVWTGTEMIVWGGGPFPFVNNGGDRYNPTTDSWSATSTTNAPAARGLHSAVWTGAEMIIWGGGADPNFLNSGGRYNPLTDSWITTSATNAPAGRVSHTAVWTGSVMIVWGGNTNSAVFASGGRYNPTTNSWSATSLVNAPTPRSLHTAVWTGAEMIVWGGAVEPTITSVLNSGGRYNPASDTWIATSATNVPTARVLHTAVWTGAEMIVWGGGGSTSGIVYNDGGRYSPTSDSWSATNTTNATAARFSHTAVWTGAEMIVWGGIVLGEVVNGGGRYNPLTDSWNATNLVNAPSGRLFHTAVWTGAEMIVWGGEAFGDDVGGIYRVNTAPTITPATIARQQGAAGTVSTIATVNDVQDSPGSLVVTVTSLPAGITVTGLTNTGGAITANVAAACNAALGAGTVGLRVSDGCSLTATANLTVNVTANPPPALGDYPSTSVAFGGGATVTPSGPPSDNGSISSVTATAPGFTGALAVNAATGVVTVSGAGPAGIFPVTVKATDNCGAMTTKTFTLTVAANTCGITVNPATLPQPYVAVLYARILSATPAGNYTFSVSAGALPPGLQLVTALGVTSIAGLPTTPGAYNFTIKARRNGTTCEATRSYSVTIPATIVPILECVQRNANNTYTARFGYGNQTGAAVTIPVGANNYFTPGNQNRGQTTVFQPGRVTNAFSVTFSKGKGSNLAIWFLRGPDGVLRPVSVLTTSMAVREQGRIEPGSDGCERTHAD